MDPLARLHPKHDGAEDLDPAEASFLQTQIMRKLKRAADAIHIPRADVNVVMQYPARAKMPHQIPYTNNLGFLSTTGTFNDPVSGHTHPTYLHSSGMHGHTHSELRKPEAKSPSIRIIDEKLAALFVDPNAMNYYGSTLAQATTMVAEKESSLAPTRQRPKTAPALKPATTSVTADPLASDMGLLPLRPKSASVRFSNTVSVNYIPQDNFGRHKTQAPPVAPSIVKTQTVRSNLDNFNIEKVALRRLRFVVDHNEADVEHLSLVDLVETGQVPAKLLVEFFGPEYATPHDLRVLLLQSVDKARRIRKRHLRQNVSQQITPRLEHPIHDGPAPNKGLDATFHHTHPHHVSPATPICSYSTYTATSYEGAQLVSSSVPSSERITSRGPVGETDRGVAGRSGIGVPIQLEKQHEVQALLMLTHTTSDAASNLVVEAQMAEAQQPLPFTRPTSSHPRTASRARANHEARGSLAGRATPMPATSTPSKPFTPAAKAIARDATLGALKLTKIRRVTTPNEVLDVLRQVEGSKTVLNGVVGSGWRSRASIGASLRQGRKVVGGSIDDLVLRNMESAEQPSENLPVSSTNSSVGYHTSRVRTKKSVQLLAMEPLNGEPDEDLTQAVVADHFIAKSDIHGALNEERMLRIIEKRRSKYLGVLTS
ncbi:hypothetical protein BC830DRAFT_1152703 [Chytriomyces sp. MP71]|nr:hypothetical protein BC830DRAFT_1152703 [Chytriomyces sp. MP71]